MPRKEKIKFLAFSSPIFIYLLLQTIKMCYM
jgi:hypothetical protein